MIGKAAERNGTATWGRLYPDTVLSNTRFRNARPHSKRRNDTAHGKSIPPGIELEAIQDTKYLRGFFDRMLLKLVNASDVYIDYSTPGHPIRPLAEAPPSPS
jgi:hypothetical protein